MLVESFSKGAKESNNEVIRFDICKMNINNCTGCVSCGYEGPDTNSKTEDMQIGGLGIYIVKESMDNIEYKYENNKNSLILSKNI